MSETAEGWRRVLAAFDDWITYESTEFMPWTGYFSEEGLRGLTNAETIAWMNNMISEIIPGRVDKCREAGVALEDFLPYMPNPETQETVRSMIDLNSRLQDTILAMSDGMSNMLDEFLAGGLEEIAGSLEAIATTEEDIRHHMSLYSQGFGRLQSLGLEIPDDFL
ncbi:MAG: hypothetical protein P1Q69_05775 [Candidatus Thorarchaeota archaeon]|nr:hypothetical protein [Candidatus Thorarchaeota archaeon]